MRREKSVREGGRREGVRREKSVREGGRDRGREDGREGGREKSVREGGREGGRERYCTYLFDLCFFVADNHSQNVNFIIFLTICVLEHGGLCVCVYVCVRDEGKMPDIFNLHNSGHTKVLFYTWLSLIFFSYKHH